MTIAQLLDEADKWLLDHDGSRKRNYTRQELLMAMVSFHQQLLPQANVSGSAADEVTAEDALKYAGETTAKLAKAIYRITKVLEDKDKQLAEHGYDFQNPLRRGFMLAEDLVKKTVAEL